MHGSHKDESITPFKGGNGVQWRAFYRQLLAACSGDVDKAGCSVADCFRGVDMGGAAPGAIPMVPAGTNDFRDMVRLRNARISSVAAITCSTCATSLACSSHSSPECRCAWRACEHMPMA